MNVNKLKIGKLYTHGESEKTPRFPSIEKRKIQNSIPWVDWFILKPKQPIMVLGSFNLTPATLTLQVSEASETAMGMTMVTVTGMAAALATAQAIWAMGTIMGSVTEKDWREADNLWKKRQRISGCKALVEDKVIWISEIDLKYFKEIATIK